MIQLRKSDDRGKSDLGWLQSRFSFSFADYHDPKFEGFRSLRVINQDRIQPSQGFGMHPHRDMEIITYVTKGAVQHQDSMGNQAIVKAGEIQRMTAGTGVLHSEYNASESETLELLQIWIFPVENGLPPGYDQKPIEPNAMNNQLCTLVAPKDGLVSINQDARLLGSCLETNKQLTYSTTKERGTWIQVIEGSIRVSGETLGAGDGAAVTEVDSIPLAARSESEFLLFDLA